MRQAHLSVVSLVEAFPFLAGKVPLGHFLASLHSISPRFYSISSSLRASPGRVAVTVRRVAYVTDIPNISEAQARSSSRKQECLGLCSSYLASRQPGDVVRVFLRHAHTFRLPVAHDTPVVMVGAGTGLAPFRGFWQQRNSQEQLAKGQDNVKVTTLLSGYATWCLVAGARTRETMPYAREIETLSPGIRVVEALSRCADTTERSHVQVRVFSPIGFDLWTSLPNLDLNIPCQEEAQPLPTPCA